MSVCKFTTAARQYFAFAAKRTDFMRFSKHARLISASSGKVAVEIEVLPDMADDSEKLHSGCIFALFDNVSTSAVFAKYNAVPASVAAQVHYFSPAKVGDTLLVTAEVVNRIGSQLYVEAHFHSINENRIIAKGGQTMAYPGGKGQEVKGLAKPGKI